ncbi:tRNA (adenosine(37)-N6)-threonylcarbamoyltransferase complex transferase subunit TsaD [Polymorphobacter megasporae]|nr:tRNA (adenosine(37)-N6)-threonylcarbamoyltransferase complex transferase subunit TsaD [Polymorphobacter megasporae]
MRLRQSQRRAARTELEGFHRESLCKRRRRLARFAGDCNDRRGYATQRVERAIGRQVTGFPLILGIESSCDETAVALVRGDRTIVAQAVASQDAAHRPFGGVVPEIAARAHVEVLTPMIERVLADGGVTLREVDAIAATAGPGLIGGVMVGLVTGKALAFAANKPLLAINHLEGHALSPRLVDPGLAFPYLLLLVSGGHCQLLAVDGVARYRRLATTIDDAAGEAFDKVAKLLGLGFPGGPAVEAAARSGDPARFKLPRPLLGSPEPHFSFAGLKSAVLRARDALPTLTATDAADLAAGFQAAVVDCLLDRTVRAMARMPEATALVVAGGVAANGAIRAALTGLAASRGLPFIAPPLWLCTDNAAMIAWAGAERLALGLVDGLDAVARPRWPLDPAAEPVRGAGVKA